MHASGCGLSINAQGMHHDDWSLEDGCAVSFSRSTTGPGAAAGAIAGDAAGVADGTGAVGAAEAAPLSDVPDLLAATKAAGAFFGAGVAGGLPFVSTPVSAVGAVFAVFAGAASVPTPSPGLGSLDSNFLLVVAVPKMATVFAPPAANGLLVN